MNEIYTYKDNIANLMYSIFSKKNAPNEDVTYMRSCINKIGKMHTRLIAVYGQMEIIVSDIDLKLTYEMF
jgi:hypothetical protein